MLSPHAAWSVSHDQLSILHTREKCNHPAGASDAEPPRCLICLGELGMGNTTAAAALLAALTGALPTDVCGRGTGAIEKSEKVILDYAGHKEVMFKKENLRGFLARSPYRGPSHWRVRQGHWCVKKK